MPDIVRNKQPAYSSKTSQISHQLDQSRHHQLEETLDHWLSTECQVKTDQSVHKQADVSLYRCASYSTFFHVTALLFILPRAAQN